VTRGVDEIDEELAAIRILGHVFVSDLIRKDLIIQRDACRFDCDAAIRLILARVRETLITSSGHGNNSSRRDQGVREGGLACESNNKIYAESKRCGRCATEAGKQPRLREVNESREAKTDDAALSSRGMRSLWLRNLAPVIKWGTLLRDSRSSHTSGGTLADDEHACHWLKTSALSPLADTPSRTCTAVWPRGARTAGRASGFDSARGRAAGICSSTSHCRRSHAPWST